MRWRDSEFAQENMQDLRTAWEASRYFKPEPDDFEKFLEKYLITKMEVPDDSDYTHVDFDVGMDRVMKLIALLKKALPAPAQEKEEEQGRKRKASAGKAQARKKHSSERDIDPVYLKHLRMYVTGRDTKVDWPTELTKDSDNNRARQQIQVFIREFFLQRTANLNPPTNRTEFNTILQKVVGEFLEVFHYPPPLELVYAFLNASNESGPKLWTMWCKKQGVPPPTPDMLKHKGGTIEKTHREFRWQMWKAAHSIAVRRGTDAKTTAMAAQYAEEFGGSDDAADIRRSYTLTQDGWEDEIAEKAAEFVTAAEAASAAAAASAATAAAAAASPASGAPSDSNPVHTSPPGVEPAPPAAPAAHAAADGPAAAAAPAAAVAASGAGAARVPGALWRCQCYSAAVSVYSC